MATLATAGLSSGLIKYTDGNDKIIRIVIAHICDYFDSGGSILQIESTNGITRMKLDNQAAVDAAIILLDSKF